MTCRTKDLKSERLATVSLIIFIGFDILPFMCYNNKVGRLYGSADVKSVRKVRAPQSRIADNICRGRPPSKCSRDIPPRLSLKDFGKGGKAR